MPAAGMATSIEVCYVTLVSSWKSAQVWIPAFAGMTSSLRGLDSSFRWNDIGLKMYGFSAFVHQKDGGL
jgi:hypothetical protein